MASSDTRSPSGVLLVNLGTPDAPTSTALCAYLKEFLWDRRVVDFPRILWWPILHGIILNIRPARSARLYRQIWTPEGSPLLVTSKQQQAALQAELHARGLTDVHVGLGMRYGRPSIREGLQMLAAQGCRHICVLPLFPQYSHSTTASVSDAVAIAARALPTETAITQIHDYHAHPAYIAALAASIREVWHHHGQPDRLLFSFHGIPQRYADRGDPYPGQCARTAQLVAEALALEDDAWAMAFQSRFGRDAWLKPATDETLCKWGAQGMAHVQVICPGFAADCLETLQEINMENRHVFQQAGGKAFHYIPALNARDDHIRALADILIQHGTVSGASIQHED